MGFARCEDLPVVKEAAEPPPGAAFWSSSYARLLLWPVPGGDLSLLESAMLEGEGWLDAALRHLEGVKPGKPLDGYLVLALSRPPAPDAYEEIRRIELSSRICRKHLIWQKEATQDDGEKCWCRIADVTVLGLPTTIMAPTGELDWPSLDLEAAKVWHDVSELGGKEAARVDVQQFGLGADRL